MQHVSKEYKTSMKQIWRNIGYIKVYLGIINEDAQKLVSAQDIRNNFVYFADANKPFDSYPVDHIYATAEQDFAKTDGSMYFLPESPTADFFNQGIVTQDLSGTLYVVFEHEGLDIKGLTIDFGECYPVDFTVTNDHGTHAYTGNEKSRWVTEDVFYGTTYLIITPTKMVNGAGRLRVKEFICGIANVYTDKEVQAFTYKDVVSPISEKLPSQDMTVTIGNLDRYYNADNPESAVRFLETGQEIRAYFGYDVNNDGKIEWLDPFNGYLKKWSADDQKAKFTATDRFDNMTGKYHKGTYHPDGISLYALAEDVLTDAGVDPREYFIDPYLKKVAVQNPIPIVKHTEALQMIANAGRCIMTQDRRKKITLRSSFLPDMNANSENQTAFSRVENILTDDPVDAYAMGSRDFSTTDGSMYFLPENTEYLSIGYVSDAVAGAGGTFDPPPKIDVVLEAGYTCYGLQLDFRSVAPQEFVVRTFYNGEAVEVYTVATPDLNAVLDEELQLFDRMEITFTKSIPGSRVTLDKLQLGNVTDYVLDDRELLGNTPIGTVDTRLKALTIKKWVYAETETVEDLSSGDIIVDADGQELEITMNDPAYGYAVELDQEGISCEIAESYSYYVKLRFSGVSQSTTVKYTLKGHKYTVYEGNYRVQHDTIGAEKEWKNQLVSTDMHAADLEEWIAGYYRNNLQYEFKYRGDPRVDANDLFYLQRENLDTALIRAHEVQLTYKGSWEGKMKARRNKWAG